MPTLARAALGAFVSFAAVSNGLEDTAVLLQAHAGTHSSAAASAGSGLLSGRAAMLRDMAQANYSQLPQGWQMPDLQKIGEQVQSYIRSEGEKKIDFNCKAWPWMCKEPFNCHLQTVASMQKMKTQMATDDGHANVATWCAPSGVPYLRNLVAKCLRDKDLKASGLAVYQETTRGRFGKTTAEMDGSYCFIEGHCSNTAVTYNTTLEEAEKMCDFRYGHDGWAKNFGSNHFATPAIALAFMQGGADTVHGGFYHTAITRPFVKAACAMGNYHCDVTYCRDTYCKEEYYIKKYGHLLPKVPGHLIQQRDYVA